MKTQQYLTIHRTFEKPSESEPRRMVWYLSDGQTLVDTKIDKFIETCEVPVLRFTQVSADDAILQELAGKGITIKCGHWHDLGIAKNLSAKEIVEASHSTPDSLWREFTPRPDIAALRDALARRNILVQLAGDATRRFRQLEGRNRGVADKGLSKEFDDMLQQAEQDINKFVGNMKAQNAKGKSVSMDTFLAEKAKAVPECVLFNKVAHISDKSWVSAASVVGYLNGLERFPNVASVWHYCGMHVVNGKAPKRAKGQPVTWSPKLRTALYSLGDSIMKNTKNPWRAFFDEAREQERAAHDTKCTCKHPDGHSTARARRKMVKEILKKFYLEATGQKFDSNHANTEHRGRYVAVGASAGND